MSDDLMQRAALWYAGNGIPVFPLHFPTSTGGCSCVKSDCGSPGKHPLTPHGFKDATTDLARIREWWSEWPDANVGIPTGTVSGFLVVDCDPRNGGPTDRAELIQLCGPIPETAEVITGGGGRHFYFRYAGGPVPKLLAPGVDLKGDGGYVVTAPSMHASGGRYQWEKPVGAKAILTASQPPPWLQERIAAVHPGDRAVMAANGEKWGQGQRNDKLASVAGTMRRRGLPVEAIEAALLETNRQRCDPPLPESEVCQISESVARYPLGGETHRPSNVEGWPQPVPFAQREPEDIPKGCLPGWLGDMARATAETTETPFALPALLGVAIAAACIAAKAEVSAEPGYVEPLNIYTCPAMESGNRKTSVLVRLLSPLAEWERQERGRVEPERKRLLSELRTMEARLERLRKKTAGDSDAALREIRELEAKLPEIPPAPRLYTDDCTPERLASLMAEQGGRMAVFSDEGGVFDLIAGRYSKGVPNLDLWLKSHSASPVRVDRADRSRPPILIDRPHLTVGISPQPDVLQSLRDKPGFRGRGLLARPLYGLPKSLLGYRSLEPHPLPEDVERRYNAGIRGLLEFVPENPIQLSLSPAAYTEWKGFQRALEREFRDEGKLHGLTDWGSKLPGAVLRLAGVFHAVEVGSQILHDTEIPSDTMTRSLDLGASLISHAKAVFDLMERDPHVEHAIKLVSWISEGRQTSFTARDCFRAHQTRFKRMDALLPVLALLEGHGYVRRQLRESSGGRPPSDLFEVNPAVSTREELSDRSDKSESSVTSVGGFVEQQNQSGTEGKRF
jgi:hypothetical protein